MQTIFAAPTLVQALRTTLQADTALAVFATAIPDSGDSFTPKTLETLCEQIGRVHPGLGCRLLMPLVKAKASAEDPKTAVEAWREFTEIIAEHGTNPDGKKEKPLVSFGILKRVSMILNGREREPWLKKGLREFAVPDENLLLRSPIIRIDEREKILLKIGRGPDNFFTLHTPEDLSNSRQMTLHIEVPKNWKRPLDEKTLQLLIARTLAVTVLHRLAWGGLAQGYQKVAPNSLSAPIPLVVVNRDGWTQFGPPPLPKKVEQDWQEIQRWIIDGALLFSVYQASRHMAVRAQTTAHLGAGGQKINMETLTPFWLELLRMANAPEILYRMLGNIVPSQPLFFRTLIEIDERAEPNMVQVSLGEDHDRIIFSLTAKKTTLNSLQHEEILELIWRVMNAAHNGSGEGKKKRGNPFWEMEYALDDLRDSEKQPKERKIGGSILKLLFEGHFFLMQKTTNTDFELKGLSKTERKIFINALAERHRTAHSSRSTVSKKWIVREAASDEPGGLIEIVPMEKVVLIHIHGRAADLSEQDWLFLMQALDTHPSAVSKISLASREVFTGRP